MKMVYISLFSFNQIPVVSLSKASEHRDHAAYCWEVHRWSRRATMWTHHYYFTVR